MLSLSRESISTVIYFKSSLNLCLARTLILFCSRLGSGTSRTIVLSNSNEVVYIKIPTVQYRVFISVIVMINIYSPDGNVALKSLLMLVDPL